MKKAIVLMLAAALLLALILPASAEGKARDTLNVAVTTPMTGSFFTAQWGNNTSDTDVRALIHGYNLVRWDAAGGMFVTDSTVVSGLAVTDAPDGGRTYTLVLYRDLVYTDGTPITARDYAFSILLEMSPEMAELGGTPRPKTYIEGYDAYVSGASETLAGLRVIADDQLAITVSGDCLPFFYELGLLDCNPYPISVIAPGVRVADDGRGAYLTNADETAAEPVFTADLLRKTIEDPETGYRSHPQVTSGAYRLTSYENGVATFERNPRFKGDAQGHRPTIQSITFRSMSQEELIPALRDGTVDLVNKVTSARVIRDGMALQAEDPAVAAASYPRSGLGFLSFNTDGHAGVTADLRVRQALAYLIDCGDLAETTVGEFGAQANGYYGLGQWMVRMLNGQTEIPAGDTEAWKELSLENLPAYGHDPEKAAALLEEAGWILGEDGIRRSAEGEPLSLTILYARGSAAAEGLERQTAALREAGIDAVLTGAPLDELLAQYYHTAPSDGDLIFLASNFDLVYDPASGFAAGDSGEPVWVTSALADETLYKAAVAMRQTKPGDLLTYCTRWMAFQQRFMEILPALPVYSNNYYDFYPADLGAYEPSSNISWVQAVIGATLGE